MTHLVVAVVVDDADLHDGFVLRSIGVMHHDEMVDFRRGDVETQGGLRCDRVVITERLHHPPVDFTRLHGRDAGFHHHDHQLQLTRCVEIRDVGLNHGTGVKLLDDFEGAVVLTQPERNSLVNRFLLIVHRHHHGREQDEHDDALNQNMASYFFSRNSLEDRPVIITQPRL